MKPDRVPPYAVTVHMAGGRKTRHAAQTVKAARHYAKGMACSPSVDRISIAGPDMASVIYRRERGTGC